MASTNNKLTLYLNVLCPYAQRAWLTAVEKGLDFETISVPLRGDKPDWYWKVNPRGTVPTLIHGERTIHESLLIAEYLDDAFPDVGTRLLPSDPYQRYASRFVIDQFGSQVTPAIFQLIRNQDRTQDDKLKEELTKKVKAFAELYAAESDKAGPYFLGESYSLVDLSIIPFIARFAIGLSHYRDFDLLAVDEKLKSWHDAVTQRPSWKITTFTPEALIQSMAFYTNPPQQ